jgi:hypothetical protein
MSFYAPKNPKFKSNIWRNVIGIVMIVVGWLWVNHVVTYREQKRAEALQQLRSATPGKQTSTPPLSSQAPTQ